MFDQTKMISFSETSSWQITFIHETSLNTLESTDLCSNEHLTRAIPSRSIWSYSQDIFISYLKSPYFFLWFDHKCPVCSEHRHLLFICTHTKLAWKLCLHKYLEVLHHLPCSIIKCPKCLTLSATSRLESDTTPQVVILLFRF